MDNFLIIAQEYHQLVTAILIGKLFEANYTKFINNYDLKLSNSTIPIIFRPIILADVTTYLHVACESNPIPSQGFKYINSFNLKDFQFRLLIDILKTCGFDPSKGLSRDQSVSLDPNVFNDILRLNLQSYPSSLHIHLLEYIIISRLSLDFDPHLDAHEDELINSLIESISSESLLKCLARLISSRPHVNAPHYEFAVICMAFNHKPQFIKRTLIQMFHYVLENHKNIPNLKQLVALIDTNIETIKLYVNQYQLVRYNNIIHRKSIANIIIEGLNTKFVDHLESPVLPLCTDAKLDKFYFIISVLDYAEEIGTLTKATYNEIATKDPESRYLFPIYCYFASKLYSWQFSAKVPKCNISAFKCITQQSAETVREFVSKVIEPEFANVNFTKEPEGFEGTSAFISTSSLWAHKCRTELLIQHFKSLYQMGCEFVIADLKASKSNDSALKEAFDVLYDHEEFIHYFFVSEYNQLQTKNSMFVKK